MNTILHKIKSKIVLTNNIVFFILVLFGVLYLLPREKQFEFEYQNGKPWLHEILFSPFDFALQKSKEEIKSEEDAIKKNSTSIYVYNLDTFKKVKKEIYDYHDVDTVFKNRLLHAFDSIYSVGIVDIFELKRYKKNDASEIIIHKNNIAKNVRVNDLFTLKTAFLYIKSIVKKEGKGANISIDDLIEVNVFYDLNKSKKIVDELLKEISYSKGIVAKGEKIIDKGEIVTEKEFQVLESLRLEYKKYYSNNGNQIVSQLVSNFLLIAILFLILFFYLYLYEKSTFFSVSKILFILLEIALFVVLAHLCVQYEINLYILPLVSVPILISIFINSRIAIVTHLIIIFIISFFTPNPFEFLYIQLITGIIAVFTINNFSQRSQFFLSVFYVLVTYLVVSLSFEVMKHNGFIGVEYGVLFYFLLNSLFIIFSYPLIYLFEKIFGFLSNISLMELSDTNQPLLRDLAEKAPGTFQHSMQVANLAQEVAYKVGCNPLLVRAGALYHDIGKIFTPHMFIENQGGDENIHDHMAPEKSAELILNHVTAGIEQARKRKLPKQLVDFIITHHGDRKLVHFMNKYKEIHPDKEIDESMFTYKGKRPFSKATAILMMADSVEAASRSLKNINDKKIEDIVNSVINKQIKDLQFVDVDLTFKDISTIKRVFIQKLKDIYHERIEYPSE